MPVPAALHHSQAHREKEAAWHWAPDAVFLGTEQLVQGMAEPNLWLARSAAGLYTQPTCPVTGLSLLAASLCGEPNSHWLFALFDSPVTAPTPWSQSPASPDRPGRSLRRSLR